MLKERLQSVILFWAISRPSMAIDISSCICMTWFDNSKFRTSVLRLIMSSVRQNQSFQFVTLIALRHFFALIVCRASLDCSGRNLWVTISLTFTFLLSKYFTARGRHHIFEKDLVGRISLSDWTKSFTWRRKKWLRLMGEMSIESAHESLIRPYDSEDRRCRYGRQDKKWDHTSRRLANSARTKSEPLLVGESKNSTICKNDRFNH